MLYLKKSFIYAQDYMWHWQIHFLTFELFLDDIRLGSNFHEVSYELNIHGTDLHKSTLYFFSLCHRRCGGAVVERWSDES